MIVYKQIPPISVVASQLHPFVLCVDDSNKPDQIPPEQWVKKGMIYRLVQIQSTNFFAPTKALVLAEIEPPPPFAGYGSQRFIPFPFSPN